MKRTRLVLDQDLLEGDPAAMRRIRLRRSAAPSWIAGLSALALAAAFVGAAHYIHVTEPPARPGRTGTSGDARSLESTPRHPDGTIGAGYPGADLAAMG
jgi:hypothetical protein